MKEEVARSHIAQVLTQGLTRPYLFAVARAFAMAILLTSTHVFEARAKELGLKGLLTDMKALGWVNFRSFADATDFVGGTSPSALFTRDVVKLITDKGTAVSTAASSNLKVLLMEAKGYGLIELKARITQGSDGPTPDLPKEERKARRAELQHKLGKSILMKDHLEPSYQAEKLALDMVSEDRPKFIETGLCTTREQERLGVMTVHKWVKDSAGYLRYQCDGSSSDGTPSDLLLRYTYQRKAMVLHMAGVVDYDKMEELTNFLFRAHLKPPPENREGVSFNQMLEAERAFWVVMDELCGEAGIKADPDASPTAESRPVMRNWKAALDSPDFRMALLPRERARAKAPGAAPPGSTATKEVSALEQANKGLKRKVDGLQDALNLKKAFSKGAQGPGHLPPPPKAPSSSQRTAATGNGGKSKGGGRGRARDVTRQSMPKGLIGMCAKSNDEPICFDFNLEGCEGAVKGGQCPKGLHVCCVPGNDGKACGKPRTKHSHDEH